jgi:hypothetical protein
VAAVQRPTHRTAAEAVVYPGRLDVVVSGAELDVRQHGIPKSVDSGKVQEVAAIVVTLAPDTVVSVLASAVGTSVPTLSAVGNRLGDLVREDVHERVGDPVAVGRNLVGAVPGAAAFGDGVSLGPRVSLNSILDLIVKSFIFPRHESMEAADGGTVCGAVGVLISVDEYIVRREEVIDAVNLAPIEEDLPHNHIRLEDVIFNIARVDALSVIGSIHQKATAIDSIRWTMSGIIPISAVILVPGGAAYVGDEIIQDIHGGRVTIFENNYEALRNVLGYN